MFSLVLFVVVQSNFTQWKQKLLDYVNMFKFSCTSPLRIPMHTADNLISRDKRNAT
jgi:hypothetical protein